jgi:hypothetical protein
VNSIKKSVVFGVVLILMGSIFVLGIQNAPVDPVNWRELAPFLIDLDGWDAEGDAEGESVSMMEFKISTVERDYSDGSRDLTISIVDGGFVPMVYASFKMYMGFEVDSSEEYIKSLTIEGFPGIEHYVYGDKEATVMVLINERFLITLDGENFQDTSDLINIAKTLDLNGIAALEN